MNNNYVGNTYLILEEQIKDNQFKSKNELIERINKLKEYGRIPADDSYKEVMKLLDLYDSLNKVNDIPLDTDKYKSVQVEDANVIISTAEDKMLRTMDEVSSISDEFKQIQNQMVASSKDGMVNADNAFNHMANYQREEVKFLSIDEVFLRDDVDVEILRKIKFFLENKYIDPHDYKVDIVNGLFYNSDTDDVVEIRKNDVTLEYEMYRNNKLVSGNNRRMEEDMGYEDTKEELDYGARQNVKVKKLTLNNNNMAFSKIGFLVLNIATFIAVLTMLVFLYK